MNKFRQNLVLPNSFQVQLRDKQGNKIEAKNILCHLNIHTNALKGGYYTYSFIPTNSHGKVFLTKKDIIENTELKNHYDENYPLDKTPVKFEFFLMEKDLLTIFLQKFKNYLNADKNLIEKDLRRRGFQESKIPNLIEKTVQVQQEDQKFYDLISGYNNYQLKYKQEETKITDYWLKEADYHYEIKI